MVTWFKANQVSYGCYGWVGGCVGGGREGGKVFGSLWGKHQNKWAQQLGLVIMAQTSVVKYYCFINMGKTKILLVTSFYASIKD